MNISNVLSLINISPVKNEDTYSAGKNDVKDNMKTFLKEIQKTDAPSVDTNKNNEVEENLPITDGDSNSKIDSVIKSNVNRAFETDIQEKQIMSENTEDILTLLKNISVTILQKNELGEQILDKEKLNESIEAIEKILADLKKELEMIDDEKMTEAMDKISEHMLNLMHSNNVKELSSDINEMKKGLLEINKGYSVANADVKSTSLESVGNKIFDLENQLFEQLSSERSPIEVGMEKIIGDTIDIADSALVHEATGGLSEILNESDNNINENLNFQFGQKDMKLESESVIKEVKSENKTLEQMKTDVFEKIESLQKMVVSKEKIYINLNPKQLGNVEILFQKKEDGLQITIEFDERQSKKQLEMLVDDMRKEMKDRDVEINIVHKEKNPEQENSQKKNDSSHKEGILEKETADDNSSVELFNELIEKLTKGERNYDNG